MLVHDAPLGERMDAKTKRIYIPGLQHNASTKIFIDYEDKLNEEELLFISNFNFGCILGYPKQIEALGLSPTEANAVGRANYAYKQDIMNRDRWLTGDVDGTEEGDDTLAELQRSHYTGRGAEVPSSQVRYAPADYQPREVNEDTMLTAVQLNADLERLQTAPYGDSPRNLMPGHTVQICLPFHMFQDCWGEVVAYRPQDNKYLVKIKNKPGLRDKHTGERTPEPLMYVSPNGLKRYTPKVVPKK
jgi:hypothetical protein